MGFIIMLDIIYVTDMCESRWHMPSDSQWGKHCVPAGTGPKVCVSFSKCPFYLKKAELAQGKLLLPAQVPHPGACVPASWSHGKGDFIKPPRVTVGNSERRQDNENSTDKDPGGEAELEVPGGSQLKSLES